MYLYCYIFWVKKMKLKILLDHTWVKMKVVSFQDHVVHPLLTWSVHLVGLMVNKKNAPKHSHPIPQIFRYTQTLSTPI